MVLGPALPPLHSPCCLYYNRTCRKLRDITCVKACLAIKHGRVSFLFCMLASADPLPPSATHRNLPTLPFDTVKANDEAAKPKVMQRQRDLLNQRYDLAAVILDPYS